PIPMDDISMKDGKRAAKNFTAPVIMKTRHDLGSSGFHRRSLILNPWVAMKHGFAVKHAVSKSMAADRGSPRAIRDAYIHTISNRIIPTADSPTRGQAASVSPKRVRVRTTDGPWRSS
ncbi:MAG: hypothetical protein R3E60_03940, partial [Alphaproteobacteria bacterium]